MPVDVDGAGLFRLYFFSMSDKLSVEDDGELRPSSPCFFAKNESVDDDVLSGVVGAGFAYFFISSERLGEGGVDSPSRPYFLEKKDGGFVVDGESDVLFGSAGGANGEVLLLGIGTSGMPGRSVVNGETIEDVVCTGVSPVRLASLS